MSTDGHRSGADGARGNGPRIFADFCGENWPHLPAGQAGIDADFAQIISTSAETLLRSAYGALGVTPARPPRPGNGPEHRLQGAAALAARFAAPGLSASLIGPLAEPETAARALIATLTVPGLIGRARAIEIAGNAVLPLAAALCDEPAVSRIEGIFAALPLPARYGSVRHLHEVARAAVTPTMRRGQGMLYLLGQYCTQGGCGRCPLS